MTTPGEARNSLTEAVRRQKLQQEAARALAESIRADREAEQTASDEGRGEQ